MNCEYCGDERTVLCTNCDGSGEGYVDGSKCCVCGGRGVVDCRYCTEDERAYYEEEHWEAEREHQREIDRENLA